MQTALQWHIKKLYHNYKDLIENEKELYGILKAKLTKKELKLFCICGGMVDARA